MTTKTLDPQGARGSARSGATGERGDSALASRSVDRALAVLCSFSRETPALGVTALSTRLDLTKSTVHRLLQVLMARGLVAQDPDHRRYTLGYRILALASAVPGEADLRQVSRPHMQWLRSATEETIALYAVAGDVRVCLDELESPQMLRMSAGIGRCFPLDRGAASKALLLDGPGDADQWRRATHTLSAARRAELSAELEQARARGYTQSQGETVPGAASLAAPIRGADGRIVAALNVGAPASRFTPEVAVRSAAALLAAAASIERDLLAAHPHPLPAPQASSGNV
jgi:DNA-binding IclR family transcriptional regulator